MYKQPEDKPDIPATRHASIVSTERDFGPSVPTIFVSEGKYFCNFEDN